MTQSIIFKKQLNEWMRLDGESKNLVSYESMFREMSKKIGDGWVCIRHSPDHLHTRLYELRKEN